MLDYISTQNQLHTRLVDFGLQEYMFVLQVVLGERAEVAYANTFDVAEFKRNVPSEDEEEYLSKLKAKAQFTLETQECQQLRAELEGLYRSDVQEAAQTFTGWKFSGEDVQKLLADLLHNRTQDLSESSVKDIVALLKMMYENGSLDSSDNFARHFVTIPKKYDVICPSCNHEIYLTEGVDNKCQHCGMVMRWSEEERRFYPQPQSL